jgi:putative membrane protein
MSELNIYLSLKAIHIIGVICWMAALLYLPRLFVYHVHTTDYNTLCTMEYKLIKIIMNPSMIISLVSGSSMLYLMPGRLLYGWVHVKLSLVLLLLFFHFYTIAVHKKFIKRENTRSSTFFRIINEIPSVIMIIIIFLVVFKP